MSESTRPPAPPPSPDDAAFGRVFRRGLIVCGALAIGLIAVLLIKNRGRQAPRHETTLNAPDLPAKVMAEIPNATFTDVTAASGITFKHFNGATGDKLLPETMGGGVAFFDYDGDGAPDLLFINGAPWPWQTNPPVRTPTMALFHNDGQGRFTEVTAGSGLDVSFQGMGVAVGDYDNDGRPDVFVTGVGRRRLFHNVGGGKFADVTAGAGVGGTTNDWSTSAAWFDFDNDGDLDLFVCHYVRWSRAIDFEVDYRLTGIGRAYGPPMNFEGTFPVLYRNDGGGKFTDVSAPSGVQIKNPATGRPVAKSLAVAPVDVDNDGWMDLVVANDTVQNFLLHNRRDGTFEDIGSRSGIAFDAYGLARGAMGIDSARFRNDEALGIAIGNFANEMNALYVSQPDALRFTDDAIAEGVGPASRLLLKFGLFFFDYDLDGRLDVLTANGHLEEDINKIQASQHYRQPAQLFWNRGAARGVSFVPVPAEKCGADLVQPIVGRGSAYADIDGDGDLDVVLTQIGGPPLLLRNDQTLRHHWLRLKLTGNPLRRHNRDAIGASVKIRVGSQTLFRVVMPTKSYLSQSELPITIGLGPAAQLEEITVLWPGGGAQKITNLKLDAFNEIREP